jgi:hypothetical protein
MRAAPKEQPKTINAMPSGLTYGAILSYLQASGLGTPFPHAPLNAGGDTKAGPISIAGAPGRRPVN